MTLSRALKQQPPAPQPAAPPPPPPKEARIQLLDKRGDHAAWLTMPPVLGDAPRLLCWQRRYYVRKSRMPQMLGGDQYREVEPFDLPKTIDAE